MINSKKMRLTMFAASMVAAGALTGCFNDKSADPAPGAPSTSTVQGGSSLGALVGATCNVTDSGSPAKALGSYVSDENGEGEATFEDAGVAFPIFISCTGGNYYDEATDTIVSNVGEAPLRSMVPDAQSLADVKASGGKVAVTTLTSMAAAVYDDLTPAEKTPTAAKNAIINVVKAVYPALLDNGGIQNVLQAPTVVKNATPTLDGKKGQYAAVLAGLAQIAKDSGKSPAALGAELATAAKTGAVPSTVTSNIVSTTNTYASTKSGTASTETQAATTSPTQPSGTVEKPASEPTTTGGAGSGG